LAASVIEMPNRSPQPNSDVRRERDPPTARFHVTTTYADRVLHAADRHLTGYPTSNRLLADPDDLLLVGTFDPHTGVVQPSNSEALEAWLADEHGAIPDLGTQTRPTFPPP
jgi:hypothetical protein